MAEQSQWTGALGGAGQGAAIGSAFGPPGIAIGAIAGGIGGFLAGGGEEEAQKLAEEQAQYIESAERENRRRAVIGMKQALGYTKAATYASNLQFTGSPKRYYAAQKSQFRNDMAWSAQKARIDAEMTRAGGDIVSDRIQTSGISSMITGLSTGAASGAFGSYENGKYKSPFG